MHQGQKSAMDCFSGWSERKPGRRSEAAAMVACRFLTLREAAEMYGLAEEEIEALQADRQALAH